MNQDFSICSLVPGATEILCELGLENNITGISDLCDYPSSIKSKPVVSQSKIVTEGYTSLEVELEMKRILESGDRPYDINEQWFSTHKPDLIITQDNCYICEIDVNYIKSKVNTFGYSPEVLVVDPKSISGIFNSIENIGVATDKVIESESLICGLKQRISKVRDLVKGSSLVKVISIEGVNPLVLGGNWIPEMYSILGCEYGIIESGSPALRIEIEDIIKFDPEFIFVDLCSSSLDRQVKEVQWLFDQEGFLSISAMQINNFYILNHEYFSNPGPRIVDGIELLANVLKPGFGNFPDNPGLGIIDKPSTPSTVQDYNGLV